ncbi:MAG: LysR family transcriptional regulator [SAR324 cluster bacterium]|nr:LysR family transcriptional regulator [SAR324 cluster bacterium]
MNHDQLLILDAIIKTGSFNAASEMLHRSQPSLSMAIKKLEDELGLKIFSRDKYRATLTEEGEAIYNKIKIILRHTDDLFTLSQQLSIGNEPKIWIAIDSLFPLPLMLGALKQFVEDHPETEFNLSVEYLNGAMERVLDGDADLAVTPIDDIYPHLESVFIINVSLIPVASKNFPPAQKREVLSNKEMEQHIQILAVDSSLHPHENKVSIYPKNTIRFLEDGRQWTVNNNATKKDFILAGLGWGRLPSHYIQEELLNGSLVPLHIESIKPVKVEIQLVRQRNRPLGLISQKLWNQVQQWSKGIADYEQKIEHLLTSSHTTPPRQ